MSGSLGAIVIGQIWQRAGERAAEIFSISGLVIIFLIFIFVQKKENTKKNN